MKAAGPGDAESSGTNSSEAKRSGTNKVAPGPSAAAGIESSPWEIVNREEEQKVEQQEPAWTHDLHTRLGLTPGCQSLCQVCLPVSVRTKF